ncbi:LuxR C-terminal-related transcriptional regulator [Paenibacillus sp. Cedars]|uniref:LuxR C-terminal-related transcriptional regulator n=1 Tax=Paenibacillus sp. Cedars TaxID=1980674 RepID=UPI00116251F9|nr:LuxR C-terminal-related transcriptional regulator [Paenibacillus sp. Cedars]AWP26249.1 hypothetical protein B9D94_06350 [Paenibacillus sp. Cedars]
MMINGTELGAQEPLLHSKLTVPRTVSTLIPRPRLSERLMDAMSGNVTLICAPAGFGKTTLVSEWLLQHGKQAAWVSLDSGDNQGSRFWRYISAAIAEVFPAYWEEVKPVLPLLHTEGYEQGLIVCLNTLGRLNEELILVLDDFHVIQNEILSASFSYFVDHLPRGIHVCMISRTEPGFSVARMEARQLASRLHTEDMRFTEKEGAQFFQSTELLLNEELSSALVRKTEGWITGLKLASIAMRRQENKEPFIRHFAGDSREVKQYLFEEVFSVQNDRMKQFLLTNSILKRWNVSLCMAVSGFEDSRELVESIERSHLFVVALDDKGEWFRFHHLFSEFLQRRLEQEKDIHKELLYKAAGDWCSEQRLAEEAVEYYLQGQYYEQAVLLLREMTSRVVDWEWSNLQKWLSVIPSDILLQHPVLFFSYANSLIAEESGDITEGEELLHQADAWYAESSGALSEVLRHEYLAMLHYVRGTLMVFGRNDLKLAKEEYEQVVRYAPNGIKMLFGQPEKPLQPITVKTYKIGRGHASKAIAAPYTMQMAEVYQAVNPIFLGKLFLNHAEVLYYWNDLSAAADYVSKAMTWIGQNPNRPEHDLVASWILQAKLKAAEGHMLEALELLEGGQRRMKWMDIPRGMEILHLEGIRLQLQYGDPAAALAWGEQCQLSSRDRVSVFELFDYQLFARVLVLQGRWDEAEELLDRLLYLAESEMRPIDAAEILCITAVMLQSREEHRKALIQLEEALQVSEANDFTRIFLDEGAPVIELLHELIRAKQQGRYRGKDSASLSFIRSILAAVDGMAESVNSPLEALLTSREMDVFQGLLDHLSGREIAEKLNVTYETVKTHRKRIYSKLNAANLSEAIAQAERLSDPKKTNRP